MFLQEKNLEDIATLTPDEREAIKEFSRLLREQLGTTVKEIILFGSKARGDSEKYSDIDILIVLDEVSWDIKKAISELAAEENIRHNVLISTIRYDIDIWAMPAIQASPFVMAVKREGIWL